MCVCDGERVRECVDIVRTTGDMPHATQRGVTEV